MTEPKFTEGPWCLDGHCLTTVLKKVRDKDDPDAKHLCGDFDEVARFKTIDDARLGSVAPELYEALDKAVSGLRAVATQLRESGHRELAEIIDESADRHVMTLRKARGDN